MELAEGEAGEKGADVSGRRVFEAAHPEGGGVTVGGAGEVVGVGEVVEGVRGDADDPEQEDEGDEAGGGIEEGAAGGPGSHEVGKARYSMNSEERVQATVFQKVARLGIQP
jgi:hypothetical protein